MNFGPDVDSLGERLRFKRRDMPKRNFLAEKCLKSLVVFANSINFVVSMAKYQKKTKPVEVKAVAKETAKETSKGGRKAPLLLPVVPLFFVAVWLWAWLWYGDVFTIAREYSFWSPNAVLMRFMEGRPWGALWWAGRALLSLFRWPALGAALLALMVSLSAWLVGYCLRLRGWWRLLQYLPSAAFLWFVAYIAFDLYYESEPGMVMGVPLMATIVLLLLALIIRSFSRHHTFPSLICPPKDETKWQNWSQLLLALLSVGITMGITQWKRPYVRVVTTMQRQMMEEDWRGMVKTARANSDLSYRQISAYYAIALVHTGELGDRLFDIHLDYDEPHLHGYQGEVTNAANYYIPDCDLYAGLVQPAIHHAMERMTMDGPTLRSLRLLTKAALLRSEWEVAAKYLRILEHVPFEGKFVQRYKPMLRHPELVNADPEFAAIRQVEPLHDNFENMLTQPTFLGYNASLSEGRSMQALQNSLIVHLYTKTMPQFMLRCQALQGQTPPQSVAEALLLMSGKYPQVLQAFPTLEYNKSRLLNFMQDVKPYMGSHEKRAEHALELLPKWKGYYPYYYFFGNLKATKRKDNNAGTSNQGVN